MKDIVVTGYPKSGNTWLVRLIADCLDSPAAGFWGDRRNPEESIEGLDRPGDFRVYKAHHMPKALLGMQGQSIVSIVRDPRDILLSMSRYFSPFVFYRCLRALQGYRCTGVFERAIRASGNFHRHAVFCAMRDGIASKWLEVPWDHHVAAWSQDTGCPCVRYEDLLISPSETIARLFERLNIPYCAERVKAACVRQSFDTKKSALLQAGLENKSNFLKVGRSGQWQGTLSRRLCIAIENAFGTTMGKCGYDSLAAASQSVSSLS